MPFLLRMTKAKKWILDEPDWLEEGEIPADPIFGLETKNSTMSVWEVDDFGDQFKRTVAALAVGRDTLQHFEYVLLDSETLDPAGIESRRTRGDSADAELNSCHLDLIEISGKKLLNLAAATFSRLRKEGEDSKLVDRIVRKDVARYIADGLSQGRINREAPAATAKVVETAEKSVSSSAEQVSSGDE